MITVLLVEDDEADYKITHRILAQSRTIQFQLVWTNRLSVAKEHLPKDRPDVILLDLALADSNGWKTLVKVLREASKLPVILLSDNRDEELGLKAIKEGAQDYLVKGQFDCDELTRTIRYAIERKRAGLGFKEYQERLEEMVQERTSELRRTNEQLKAHDKAKTQFVSNVSHELKTPLSSMMYAIGNMTKGIVGDVPARLRVYIDMLRDDAERLGRVIGDILDMSRLESNTMTLDCVTLPFGPLVRHIADGFRIQAEQGRLALCVSIVGNTSFVRCDPQKMERAIMNVIRNAIKFTPEQGTIEVALMHHPDNRDILLLTVTDSGIGIPKEHLPHVTERYFRVGEYVDGTGLGLAIAKEIVVLHGGELLLHSPPPGRAKGTQVQVTLPLAPPPTILAVDDDRNVLDVLSRQLDGAGYRVVACMSPTEALTRLSEISPGLILTDIVMPDMDGINVVATIRSSQQWRRIPVAAITGAKLNRAQREILEGLNIPTLYKPWRLEQLLAFVEDTMTGNRNLIQPNEKGTIHEGNATTQDPVGR